MNTTLDNSSRDKVVLRVAVGAMFFMAGLCFASWASRIGNIQQNLGLSLAALGGILLAIPVGLLASLPFSGWIITKIGSKHLLVGSLTVYGVTLISLGLAQNSLQLFSCLFLFGFSSNAVNISVNTQAVAVEKLYSKPIMASFHGLWSLAGFAGAGIGSLMIAEKIDPYHHFVIISGSVIASILIAIRSLNDDRSSGGGPVFVMPDSSLIKLGIIAFCSMICEGTMFDWSTIYFRDVIHPSKELVGIGFTSFMLAMASGRFVADWFAHRFGLKNILMISGSLTAGGLLTAVVFPYLLPGIFGFILVGLGVSSVVPMIYSAAGKSKTMAPGVAIAAVSTIGFFGFLFAPPLIGFIASIATLRASFLLIACMGVSVVVVSARTRL